MNTNATMTATASALLKGATIKNGTESRVKTILGSHTDADLWSNAVKNAHSAFYAYAREVHNTNAGHQEEVRKAVVDNAFNAINGLLALIGEVNGFALKASPSLLAELSGFAIKTKDTVSGRAYELKSEMDNYRRQIRTFPVSGSPEALAQLQTALQEKQEEYMEACKEEGSKVSSLSDTTLSSFTRQLEDRLATLIARQAAKSWEELREEEQERKKARNKKTAEKRKNAKTAN